MKIISFFTTLARPLIALIIICITQPALATLDLIDQLAKALKEIVQTADIVTPTRAIEILGKNIIYKDDVNHIYQIGVTLQGTNECWMHGPRNTFFLTAMFSGVTKLEFGALYDAMKNSDNIDAFKNKLSENDSYKNAIETCNPHGFGVASVISNLDSKEGKQIPENSAVLIKNIVDFMYLEGLDENSDGGFEKNSVEVATSIIKEVESVDDLTAKRLAHEAFAAGRASKVLERYEKEVLTCLGVELIFFTGMQHSTALVICKEKGEYYYFFADSLGNSSFKTSRAKNSVGWIKSFIENDFSRV